MAENSKIEWTDHTFNPWVGCSKVSPGCQYCYAEQLMDLRYSKVQWGPKGTRQVTSEANWKLPLKWNKRAKREGRRYRVFCASLADVFEDREEVIQWRANLFAMIERTRNLDWLLLTKRPENVCQLIGEGTGRHSTAWLADCNHVWIGTSIENQETADERIPHLLTIPAAVRFLSIEPLLGPIDLGKWLCTNRANWQCQKCGGFLYSYDACNHCGGSKDYLTGSHVANKRDPGSFTGWTNRQPIDWVIVGGESGQHARPMHPEWARSLRDQCVNAGVPFFFKQWGEWGPCVIDEDEIPDERSGLHIWNPCGGGPVGYEPRLWNASKRVGKKATGRLLDGREWNEVPEVNQNQLFDMGGVQGSAIIDETGRYRYSLTRIWDKDRLRLCWIMLNPSIADEANDDPTIRRCIGFAQHWGYGSIEVLNLFAWRSTDPQAMFMHGRDGYDIVGHRNDGHISSAASISILSGSRVFAAWGDCGKTKEQRDLIINRAAHVQELFGETWCLGITKRGNPRHPLYVPNNIEPIIYHKQWRTIE